MKRQLLYLIALYLLVISCENNNLFVDPDYPTTFKRLSDEKLSQLRISLTNEYPYIRSTLNDFGFCWPNEFYEVKNPPSNSHLLTESESIELAKEFVSKHPTETGIENPEDLTISKVYSLSKETLWTVVSSFQKVDTIEVLYSDIVFRFDEGELVNCTGNWFPNIYIPSKFNFTETEAKNNIIGKRVSHFGWTGEYFETISKSSLEKCRTSLKIVSLRLTDKIELRVAWEIYLPSVSAIVYVDVMTGLIIRQESTIIAK